MAWSARATGSRACPGAGTSAASINHRISQAWHPRCLDSTRRSTTSAKRNIGTSPTIFMMTAIMAATAQTQTITSWRCGATGSFVRGHVGTSGLRTIPRCLPLCCSPSRGPLMIDTRSRRQHVQKSRMADMCCQGATPWTGRIRNAFRIQAGQLGNIRWI